jgi:hypothetical protein
VRGTEHPSREYLVLGHGAHTANDQATDHLSHADLSPGRSARWEQLFNVTEDPHLTEDLLPTQPELDI